MKTTKKIKTILKEIETKGSSTVATYSFSRINRYFNFHQTHKDNTFIFREFVDNQSQEFKNELLNDKFVLFLEDDFKIKAYKNIESIGIYDKYLLEDFSNSYKLHLQELLSDSVINFLKMLKS